VIWGQGPGPGAGTLGHGPGPRAGARGQGPGARGQGSGAGGPENQDIDCAVEIVSWNLCVRLGSES
jgi:hypothetical protein